mmetsp:Transcript_46196/g.84621  ORF Transcript_46196/g.84621 Transcript_46196/m.84621 type:complete len:227 (-) Transcript_46196:199-879(-)
MAPITMRRSAAASPALLAMCLALLWATTTFTGAPNHRATFAGATVQRPPLRSNSRGASRVAAKVSDSEMPFGKYKGMLFSQIVAEAPDYCEWVLSLKDPSPPLAAFITYLKEIGFVPPKHDGNTVMSFGKHEGLTYQQIMDGQKSYCRYVLSIDKATGRMRKLQEFLQENYKPEPISGDTVVEFGKYTGSTFKEVEESFPDYCTYMLDLPDPKGQVQEFLEYLRQK